MVAECPHGALPSRYGATPAKRQDSGSQQSTIIDNRLLIACFAFAALLVVACLGPHLSSSGPVSLEERGHGYLGDPHALTTTQARRQAESVFEAEAQRIKHPKLRRGMSSRQARDDLSSFFDTLGLNGNSDHHRDVDVKSAHLAAAHSRLAKAAGKPAKTTVNIYIKEDTNAKKAAVKERAAVVRGTKKSGVPMPLIAKARQQQLADRPMSKFDREMAEARSLLQKSKMESALTQARSISLKADAPYYTS